MAKRVTAVDDASYYDQDHLWGRGIDERNRRRLRDTTALIPPDVGLLMDVGAGDGEFVLEASRPGRFVMAVERSTEALAHLRVPAVRASADALPVRERSADIVTACEVLEHLPFGVFEEVCREIPRIARQYILVTVPNAEPRHAYAFRCPYCACVFHPNRHVRSFDRDALIGLFDGFVVQRIEEIGPAERRPPSWLLALGRRVGFVPPRSAPLCPQCGYHTSPSESVGVQATNEAARRRRFLRPLRGAALLPARRVWLAALYKRTR